jgi:hypothetical protein
MLNRLETWIFIRILLLFQGNIKKRETYLFICFFLNWRKVKIFIKNVKRKGISIAITPRDKLRYKAISVDTVTQPELESTVMKIQSVEYNAQKEKNKIKIKE